MPGIEIAIACLKMSKITQTKEVPSQYALSLARPFRWLFLLNEVVALVSSLGPCFYYLLNRELEVEDNLATSP